MLKFRLDMIYRVAPTEFSPKFELAGVIVEYNGKILLLQRHINEDEGGKWGIPAGKVEINEPKDKTAARELFEETGLNALEENIKFSETLFVKYPNYDFLYHVFYLNLEEFFDVVIRPNEHLGFKWVVKEKLFEEDLVLGQDTCFRFFFEKV